MSATFDQDCVFCKIARGDFGTKFVRESERCLAFRDIDPKAPVHILVIPREHISSVTDLSDGALAADLLSLCVGVANELGIGDSGYRILTNTGPDAGQSVGHLHFHVLGGHELKAGLG